MTREQSKELLPLIKAFAEGKTIESLDPHGNWKETKNPIFTDSLIYSCIEYRIKPESECRPFNTQEECWNEMQKHPNFGWVKYCNSICFIQNISSNGITIVNSLELCYFNFMKCFDCLKFADGTPFGIKEE